MAKRNDVEVSELELQRLVMDLEKYFSRVEKYTLNLLHQRRITKEEFRERAIKYLTDKAINRSVAKKAVIEFEKLTFGYNILDALIEDETISDIRIISENNIANNISYQ